MANMTFVFDKKNLAAATRSVCDGMGEKDPAKIEKRLIDSAVELFERAHKKYSPLTEADVDGATLQVPLVWKGHGCIFGVSGEFAGGGSLAVDRTIDVEVSGRFVVEPYFWAACD